VPKRRRSFRAALQLTAERRCACAQRIEGLGAIRELGCREPEDRRGATRAEAHRRDLRLAQRGDQRGAAHGANHARLGFAIDAEDHVDTAVGQDPAGRLGEKVCAGCAGGFFYAFRGCCAVCAV
jgi:hypothetical protein